MKPWCRTADIGIRYSTCEKLSRRWFKSAFWNDRNTLRRSADWFSTPYNAPEQHSFQRSVCFFGYRSINAPNLLKRMGLLGTWLSTEVVRGMRRLQPSIIALPSVQATPCLPGAARPRKSSRLCDTSYLVRPISVSLDAFFSLVWAPMADGGLGSAGQVTDQWFLNDEQDTFLLERHSDFTSESHLAIVRYKSMGHSTAAKIVLIIACHLLFKLASSAEANECIADDSEGI